MATKRLGAAKKRRRNSTLIANPRRKKRKATAKRKAATKRKRRKANPAAPKRRRRRRSTTLAKRRKANPKRRALSRKRLAAPKRRRRRRKNPNGMAAIKKMFTDLPILEIVVAGAGAVFVSNVIAGIPFVKKQVGKMDAGFAKDAVGGLVGPVATFGTGIAIMYFGAKSEKAKKIGQFLTYAALFQATNAVLGAQVQKGVAAVLKTAAGEGAAADAAKDAAKSKDKGGGFGGAWIGNDSATYGGLLGAGAYFTPDDPDLSGAYMAPDAPIKIAGFGGFN